jgi:hypothetical protein
METMARSHHRWRNAGLFVFMSRHWWFGLLVSLAAAVVPAVARAYDGFGHPTFGYSYGPEFNYGYFSGRIFGGGADDKVCSHSSLGCPILCISGYWHDTKRRRPIAIIRENGILIR